MRMKWIVIRLNPINSLSLEIFMKTLICKNCGFTFLKESIWSRLAEFIFPMDLIFMFSDGPGRFRKEGIGSPASFGCSSWLAGSMEKFSEKG